MKRIPAEDNIELLLSFADSPPGIDEYESIARKNRLRVVTDDIGPDYRLFKGDQFGLMLVDGQLARLHAAGLFGDEGDVGDEALGVVVVTSVERLSEIYQRLLQQLSWILGPPAKTGVWAAEIFLGFDDDERERMEQREFGYAAWDMGRSLLVLLMNDEGDAHIGEMATVDLRIAPRDALERLPDSVNELLGWPVEY